MKNTQYNGWTNYATWRIALEWFGGDTQEWYDEYGANVSEMREALQEYVEEGLMADITSDASTVCSYSLAFLVDVNWYEIAKHIIDDFHIPDCPNCGQQLEYPDDKFCSDQCKKITYLEHIDERI